MKSDLYFKPVGHGNWYKLQLSLFSLSQEPICLSNIYLLYIGVTSSFLIGYKHAANSCLLCFSYVIPTDNRFYICRIDVIPTDNSFMHAEVTSPNTNQQFDQFCHGGAQLKNMHNKTIIEFGFRMLAIIIKASVWVIRLSLRLQQITQTLALIIIANMLNLIQ